MALQPYTQPKTTSLSGYTPPPPPQKKVTTPNVAGAIGGLLSKLKPTAPTQAQTDAQKAAFEKSFPTLAKTGYATAAPIGVQAKAPEQNKQAPVTSLPQAQVKTTVARPTETSKPAAPTQATPAPVAINNKAVIPTDPSGTYTPTATQQPTQATPTPYAVNGGLYGQLITGLANRSTQPGQQYTDAMKQYNSVADQIKQSQMNQAQAEATNRLNPIPIGDQTGREAVIRSQYGQQQQALASRLGAASNVLGAANTQQGLLQQALQQAAAGAAPQIMAGGQYQASPLGGGAPNAAVGMQQGVQAATQWGIAQQNINQAVQYQAQAQDISNGLQLLEGIKSKVVPFMQEAGLNPATAPILNTQINKIDAQANPVAFRTMNEALALATSAIQQMLQAQGGMTPTDAGNLVRSYNLADLTPQQLNLLLQNMEVTGNMRLSQAQSAADAARQANFQGGGAPAQGVTAQVGQFQAGGNNQLDGIPDWLKAVAGIGASTAGAAAGAAGNVLSGGIGGAAGGLAAKVLGI